MRIFKKLTKRQTEVYDLLLEGMSYQEIADTLDLSVSNIKSHVSNILTIFDEPSTLSLVVSYYKNQLHIYNSKYS